MQFVVSEQASSNTAMVHRHSCRKAQTQEKRSLDIRVHGPFATGEQAMSAAARNGSKAGEELHLLQAIITGRNEDGGQEAQPAFGWASFCGRLNRLERPLCALARQYHRRLTCGR